MKTRLIVVAGSFLVIGTLVAGASRAHSAPPADGSKLVLTLALDRTEYEVGQPILAFVTVVNRGPSSFRDLAYMDPGSSQLGLQIFSAGHELQQYGHSDLIIFESGGIELEPGGCACETIDGLYWFGTGLPQQIPQGVYRACARMSARLQLSELPSFRLTSDTLTFRIVPTAHPGSHVWDADSLTQSKEEPYSTVQMLRNLQDQEAAPAFIAAVVDRRIRGRLIGDTAKLRWIAELREVARSREVRCALDSMERKIRQKKFYYSYGP
jgi:hypothetical protein